MQDGDVARLHTSRNPFLTEVFFLQKIIEEITGIKRQSQSLLNWGLLPTKGMGKGEQGLCRNPFLTEVFFLPKAWEKASKVFVAIPS